MLGQLSQLAGIRIFLSSPGDVADERKLALGVIDRLLYDPFLRGKVAFEVVAWDKPGAGTPMLGTMTPQAAIDAGMPKPSECDIVVVIFWTRMGTPLPFPEYQKPDGEPYLSGTEWEYYDAFNAAQATGKPLLVIYQRDEKVLLDDEAPDFAEKQEQKQRVRDFFAKFVDPQSGAILRGVNKYKNPADFQREFETHLRVLVKRLLDAPGEGRQPDPERVRPADLWQGSPFPGLRAFTDLDAPIFFGRERETDELIHRLQRSRFISVVGASGSGKSSLIGAGLIPRLRHGALVGSQDWLLPSWNQDTKQWTGLRFTPAELGDNPFLALAAKLAPWIDEPPGHIAAKLAQTPTYIETLGQQILQDKDDWVEIVLFVDQFEELFASTIESFHGPFIQMLVHAAQSRRMRVIMTVRADFYQQCVGNAALGPLLRQDHSHLPLSVPDQEALREMIERPAERAGLTIQPGLTNRILEDVEKAPGALPLLGYALEQLYIQANQSGEKILSHADYDRFGGVEGAIGIRAEAVFGAIGSTAAKEAFSKVVRALVQVDSRGVPVKQRARLDQFAEIAGARQFIDTLIEARLLVASEDSENRPVIEVAHEALFAQWERLKSWLAASQRFLLWRSQFQTDVGNWHQAKRGKRSYLYSGYRLRQATAMIRDNAYALDDRGAAFIRQCRRWLWLYRGLVGLVMAIPILFSLYFLVQVVRVEGLKREARGPSITFPGGRARLGYPPESVNLPSFSIDMYEVTNAQYALCVEAGACSSFYPQEQTGVDDFDRLPVTGVTAYQAQEFCEWIGRRLPSAVEWERAIRGTDGRAWPWGSEDDPPNRDRVNMFLTNDRDYEPQGLVAVDTFEEGATPEGIRHLVGNASEWTRTPSTCAVPLHECSDVWDGRSKKMLFIYDPGWQFPLTSIGELLVSGAPTDPSMNLDDIGFRCASD